jgi:hypothetical protein
VDKPSLSLFFGPALMGLAALLVTCGWIYLLFAVIPSVTRMLFG